MRVTPRLRRGCLSVALALLLGVAAPVSAEAVVAAQFHLRTGNGYEIEVGGSGATVELSAAPAKRLPGGAKTLSAYIARGTASSSAIEAEFGRLGSVDVRFRPSGVVVRKKEKHACPGAKPTVIRYGRFVGSIRFRGEGGYVSVRAHRAVGKVVSKPLFICTFIPPGRNGRARASAENTRTVVEAGEFSAVSGTLFAGLVRTSDAFFLTEREKTEGSVAFFRLAYAKASPLTFASDDALSFASVTPPPPFTGSASLQRNPDGTKSWTGDLAVSFPGEAGVPLAGPDFITRLGRSWPGSGYETEPVPRLRLALISRLLALAPS